VGVGRSGRTGTPLARSRKELKEKGPPRVLQELKDVMLIEGSAARLECRISAFPDPFIRWSKDGQELKDGPKYRYIFEDPDIVALVVRDGGLADLGRYTIAVKNTFGECSDSARILVEGNTPAPVLCPQDPLFCAPHSAPSVLHPLRRPCTPPNSLLGILIQNSVIHLNYTTATCQLCVLGEPRRSTQPV
uniref:Ig-like domain-containing protein n=1 Tax=Chrysemys picta bellii TaxID=8478 RepID=A0A8C3HGV5_CHRPI